MVSSCLPGPAGHSWPAEEQEQEKGTGLHCCPFLEPSPSPNQLGAETGVGRRGEKARGRDVLPRMEGSGGDRLLHVLGTAAPTAWSESGV